MSHCGHFSSSTVRGKHEMPHV